MDYTQLFIKFALGILTLIIQINVFGKSNLAPTTALDQLQNYVLGGIIGGLIYNSSITIIQFLLVLVIWTLVVFILKFGRERSNWVRNLIDGKPVQVIKNGKNYFIATSAFGHFFETAGFEQEKIFDVFGDWTRMQCSSGLNHGTYSDLSTVKRYINGQGEIPRCEDCDSPMEIHMPLNAHFFPDEDANTRFRWFLTRNQTKKVVVLELGVDPTSPQLLDPMVKLVEQFKDWHYVAADLSQDELPDNIQKRSAGLGMALPEVIEKISKNEG